MPPMSSQSHANPVVLLARRLSVVALACVATLWAGSLVIVGLWLVYSVGPRWPMFSVSATLGGWTAVAMGAFVFMFLVADRVFPKAGRSIGWLFEVCFVLLFTMGFVATALTLWFGGGS